jgi:hypothetical protein
MATAVVRTTARLPVELDERLAEFCETRGAVKNRVIAIAVRSYLDEKAPPLAVQPPTHAPDRG